MVRVLALADEEVPAAQSRVRELSVDLVLAAGDLPWDFLESIVSALGVPGAYVPGNHDPRIGRGTPKSPRGMLSVDDQVREVAGLRIAGLGGCVRYNTGHHQYTQQEYDRRARRLVKIARGAPVDVLLTHAPPLGLGDEPDPPHAGIAALHEVIETLQPTWHLHGHIHPYAMSKPDRRIGSTTICNVIPWQVLEIEPQSAAVSAGRGA
jgi:Icc-related predicted phosphoesterase